MISKSIRRALKKKNEKPSEKYREESEGAETPPSLIGIINAVLREREEPRENYFRPSMLFGCDRANVFHYLHSPAEPPKLGGKMHRTLDNGTYVHELVQNDYLSHTYDFYFVKEPKVRIVIGTALLKGSCDGVLIQRASGFRWGIEIKTINHDEFSTLSKPKPEHVKQAMTYCKMQKLDWMTILYWDKDKCLLKEYHVSGKSARAAARWREARQRVRHLKVYVDKFDDSRDPDDLPAYDKDTCNKSFCHFVKYCRRMEAPV